VESPHELALLDQAARAAGRRADVLLRVNLPGQDEQAALVMGGKPSPFGMDVEQLRRCTPFPPSVRLRGLHAHLASGLGADGLLAAAGRLVSFGRQLCA
ncbi:MAG TPA: type III PLP-dependent enzyme, partial [Streptosporangiaceae bacterium]|nr:type III PLP-dependent enzyme [Streptosporangiaceae bacterium]